MLAESALLTFCQTDTVISTPITIYQFKQLKYVKKCIITETPGLSRTMMLVWQQWLLEKVTL